MSSSCETVRVYKTLTDVLTEGNYYGYSLPENGIEFRVTSHESVYQVYDLILEDVMGYTPRKTKKHNNGRGVATRRAPIVFTAEWVSPDGTVVPVGTEGWILSNVDGQATVDIEGVFPTGRWTVPSLEINEFTTVLRSSKRATRAVEYGIAYQPAGYSQWSDLTGDSGGFDLAEAEQILRDEYFSDTAAWIDDLEDYDPEDPEIDSQDKPTVNWYGYAGGMSDGQYYGQPITIVGEVEDRNGRLVTYGIYEMGEVEETRKQRPVLRPNRKRAVTRAMTSDSVQVGDTLIYDGLDINDEKWGSAWDSLYPNDGYTNPDEGHHTTKVTGKDDTYVYTINQKGQTGFLRLDTLDWAFETGEMTVSPMGTEDILGRGRMMKRVSRRVPIKRVGSTRVGGDLLIPAGSRGQLVSDGTVLFNLPDRTVVYVNGSSVPLEVFDTMGDVITSFEEIELYNVGGLTETVQDFMVNDADVISVTRSARHGIRPTRQTESEFNAENFPWTHNLQVGQRIVFNLPSEVYTRVDEDGFPTGWSDRYTTAGEEGTVIGSETGMFGVNYAVQLDSGEYAWVGAQTSGKNAITPRSAKRRLPVPSLANIRKAKEMMKSPVRQPNRRRVSPAKGQTVRRLPSGRMLIVKRSYTLTERDALDVINLVMGGLAEMSATVDSMNLHDEIDGFAYIFDESFGGEAPTDEIVNQMINMGYIEGSGYGNYRFTEKALFHPNSDYYVDEETGIVGRL